MLAAIGIVIVLASIAGGYALAHGNFAVLVQIPEFIIIVGAATGALVLSSTSTLLKNIVTGVIGMFTHKGHTKEEYLELLQLMNDIFFKITRDGLLAIEGDVDNPHESPLFSKYEEFLKNEYALNFVTDTLRTLSTTSLSPHELEPLLDLELEKYQEDLAAPGKMLNTMAESFPGLGIVAAVLGVVITMQHIDGPVEELGHSVGAALVGTMIGVFMCYGLVGPIAHRVAHNAEEEVQYLDVIKIIFIGFVSGLNPRIALEFGRRVISHEVRPTFSELEEGVFLKK